ncbi:MAG: hypothetical protein ABW199_06140 [Caulobacterales bacterium]
MNSVEFRGASGRYHRFTAYRPDDHFPAQPAVYCFARPAPGGRGFVPVFLSRTGNLAARMERHEQWEEACLLGATHVLIHQREERDAREFVEHDLFSALRPLMNGPLLDADLVEEAAPTGPRLVWAA